MRLYSERRPTEQAAIAAATRAGRWTPPASAEVLAVRLRTAVRNDDGAGLRLLTAHLSRTVA
jgi:hypothetical protein